MGIFDKFKSKKEQEITGGAAATEAPKKSEAKAKKAEPKEKKAKKSTIIPENLLGVIKSPLVTEKAAHQAHDGKYSFRVDRGATRIAVRDAVKALYGVLPVSVNVMVVRGKVVRFGKKSGQRQTWKKAIVTLPKGKSIDVYEGV